MESQGKAKERQRTKTEKHFKQLCWGWQKHIPINHHFKCKWTRCQSEEHKSSWTDTQTPRPIHMLSAKRLTLDLKSHTDGSEQTEAIPHKRKWKEMWDGNTHTRQNDFKTKDCNRRQRGRYLAVGINPTENVTLVNTYIPNTRSTWIIKQILTNRWENWQSYSNSRATLTQSSADIDH